MEHRCIISRDRVNTPMAVNPGNSGIGWGRLSSLPHPISEASALVCKEGISYEVKGLWDRGASTWQLLQGTALCECGRSTQRKRRETLALGQRAALQSWGLLNLSGEPFPITALATVTSLTPWLGWSVASPVTDAPVMPLLCLVCGLGFIQSTQGFLAHWIGCQPLNTRRFCLKTQVPSLHWLDLVRSTGPRGELPR